MARIFVYVAHKAGVPDDAAFELLSAAKRIDPDAVCSAIVSGRAAELEGASAALRNFYPEVWTIGTDALAYPNAELIRQALFRLLPPASIVLLAHDHFGIDLGPGLSVKLNAAFVSDLTAIEGLDHERLRVVRQEFGGQLSTHVACDISAGAVLTVRPGAFKPPARAPANGTVVDKSSVVGTLTARRRYVETIVPEAGDVDITKYNILVSVGRGIQEKDNIALVQELAEVLDGAVCCSRPVVDAKWLEKSRQVGSSGKTVKPKVYVACGISGAFQHLAGLKGSPFIIAINKNPKAPIFQVADIGIVDDILEFLPELTARVREARKLAA